MNMAQIRRYLNSPMKLFDKHIAVQSPLSSPERPQKTDGRYNDITKAQAEAMDVFRLNLAVIPVKDWYLDQILNLVQRSGCDMEKAIEPIVDVITVYMKDNLLKERIAMVRRLLGMTYARPISYLVIWGTWHPESFHCEFRRKC